MRSPTAWATNERRTFHFSEQLKEPNKRYAVRGGGGAGLSRGRSGGVRDVPAGASLAVKRRP